MHRLKAALIAGLVLGLQAVPVRADEVGEDHDEARQAVEAGEILPLPRILERVRRAYPGQVLEVELERKGGRWMYEIRLLQPDGRLVRIDVDARSGEMFRRGRHGNAGKGGGH